MKYLIAFSLIFLSACVALTPMEVAKTPLQRAYALYGTYTVVLEVAAKVTESSVTPLKTKLAIGRAAQEAKPATDELYKQIMLYMEVKQQVEQGTTEKEKLEIVNKNLESWYYQVRPLILKMAVLLGGKLDESSNFVIPSES